MAASIQINHLRKVYGNNIAVDELNTDFYAGQFAYFNTPNGKVVKCIEENFKEDTDKIFVDKLKNKSIGNYHAQRTFLFTQYKRYNKCIKENILFYPNGTFKREYYY